MRFFHFTYSTDECQRLPWRNTCGTFTKILSNRTWIRPDDDYKDYDQEEDLLFRMYVVDRGGVIDIDEVDALIRQACIEWKVKGNVSLTKVEETTFEKCFDCTYSYKSRFLQGLARDLQSEEYFAVLTERDFVADYLIAPSESPEQDLEAAKTTNCSVALAEEMVRIQQCFESDESERIRKHGESGDRNTSVKSLFVPVFYLIEGSSQRDYRPIIDALAGSLSRCGRILSRDVVVLDIDRMVAIANFGEKTFEYFTECLNDAFAQSLVGTNLVIKYGAFDNGDTFDLRAWRVLARIADVIDRNPDCMQAYFVVPPNSDDLRMRIAQRIALPAVEILRDKRPGKRLIDEAVAMTELSERAKRDGLGADSGLRRTLQHFMAADPRVDLDMVYRAWFRTSRTRLHYPAYLPLVEKATDARFSKKDGALEKLDKLIGLEEPKRQMREILLRMQMNAELTASGIDPILFNMNMVFTGSPGTGKTEVARLYAEILKEQRVLSEGRLISVSGSQLVGTNMEKLFEAASGSLLFIDEAYALMGAEVTISALIACMENRRDDVVVILAGYKDEMASLLRCNPGFRSRIGSEIDFPDYTEEEKVAIFEFMANHACLEMSAESLSAVREVVARGGSPEDEGNARFVRQLFENACGHQQVRLATERPEEGWSEVDLKQLEPQDIYGDLLPSRELRAREELEGLIGLEKVKKLVRDRLDFMSVQKARRDLGITSSFVPMHMAFKGSPGSGKTEVARLIGRILKEEGVLSRGDFFECGRQDLVGAAVGQTAIKVASLFKKAKGSVIFIDEAYTLCENYDGYGEEAITAIIDHMEKLREDVVVIFAGYTKEIDKLLDTNPGFKSRVRTQIEFPDYSVSELCDILDLMARKGDMVLTDEARDKAKKIIGDAVESPGFGNARFARNLLEEATVAQGARVARECAARGLRPEDLEKNILVTLEAADFKVPAGKTDCTRVGFLA